MADNIKVAVRIRPLIAREENQAVKWVVKENKHVVKSSDPGPVPESYTFDYVFDKDCDTSEVHESCVLDIVDSAMQGFNGTVFAYGQTSSGKTHTIMGNENEDGVLGLAVDRIFETIANTDGRTFLVVVSFMELYKEELQDLIPAPGKSKPALAIRENGKGEVFVANLTEEKVYNQEELMSYMRTGNERRHISATDMNERSSRSHTIFRIIIESTETNDDGTGSVTVSHLNIVDLAGSEKSNQAGTQGDRLKEGSAINKSLMTLTRVINQLVDNEPHVSFRDSKLTRILQNALGGNSKTVIVCNVTPVSENETSSTLKFASNAKRIKNHPHKNELISEETQTKKYQMELKLYQKKYEQLQKEMEQVKENREVESIEKEKMNEEQMIKLRKEIDNMKKFMLTSATATPKMSHAQRAARRRTWCPGAMGAGQSMTPSPISRLPSTYSARRSEDSQAQFCSQNKSEVLEDWSEIEHLKRKQFYAQDVNSPGSVPKKRHRFVSFPVPDVIEEQVTPPANDANDVQIQTDPIVPALHVSAVQSDLRICEMQDELQAQRDLFDQVQQEKMELLQKVDDMQTTVNEKSILEERVTQLERELEKMKENEVVAQTPTSPSPAVDLVMEAMRNEIETLKKEKVEMQNLVASGLGKEVEAEMQRLAEKILELETENECLKNNNTQPHIKIDLAEDSATGGKKKGRRSINLMSFDDDCSPSKVPIDESLVAQRNQLLTPIAEDEADQDSMNIIDLSNERSNLIDHTQDMSRQISADLAEPNVAELHKMVEEALTINEDKQEKIVALQKIIEELKTESKGLRVLLDERNGEICSLRRSLEDLDSEYMDLRSFQVHEMSAVAADLQVPKSPSRGAELLRIKDELAEANVELRKLNDEVELQRKRAETAQQELAAIKGADLKEVKDQLDWKATAEEYNSSILEIKEKLTMCQTKLQAEQEDRTELKTKYEKLVKENENNARTVADYEWFLEEEKRKNKAKIGELTAALDQATQHSGNDSQQRDSFHTADGDELEKLRDELKELNQVHECCLRERDTLTSQLEELKSKSAEVAPAVQLDCKPYEEQVTQISFALAKMMDTHGTSISEWMAQYEGVLGDCESKLASVSSAITVLQQPKADHSVVSDEHSMLNTELNDAQDRIQQLEKEKQELVDENNGLHHKLVVQSCDAADDSELHVLKADIAKLQTQVHTLTTNLNAAQQEKATVVKVMDGFETIVVSLTAEKLQLEQELHTKNDELQRAASPLGLKEAQQAIEVLQKEKQDLLAENDGLHHRLIVQSCDAADDSNEQRLREQIASLTTQLDKVKQSLDTAQKDSENLVEMREDFAATVSRLTAEKEHLEQELQGKNEQLERAASPLGLKEAQQAIEVLEKQKPDLLEENDGLHHRLIVQSCDAADNSNEQQLIDQIATLTNQLDKVKQSLATAHKKGAEVEGARNELETLYNDLKLEKRGLVESLTAQMTRLQEKLGSKEVEMESVSALLEQAREALSALQRDSEHRECALKEQIDQLRAATTASDEADALQQQLFDLKETKEQSEESLRSDIVALRESVSAKDLELSVVGDRLKAVEQELSDEKASREENEGTLVTELEELKKIKQDKENELSAEITRLRASLDEMSEEKGDMVAKVENLEKLLASSVKEDELSSAISQLDSANQALHELKMSSDVAQRTLQSEIESLQTVISDKECEVCRLHSELDNVKTCLVELQQTSTEKEQHLNDQITSLQDDVTAKASLIESLSSECDGVKGEVSELKLCIEQLELRLKVDTTDFTCQATPLFDTPDEETAALQFDYAGRTVVSSAAQTDAPCVRDGEVQVSDMAQQLAAAEARVAQLQQQCDEVSQATTDQLAQTEEMMVEKHNEVESLKQQRDSLQERLKSVMTTITELECAKVSAMREKQEQIDHLHGELANANLLLDQQQEKIKLVHQYEAEIGEKNAEIKRVKQVEELLRQSKRRLEKACDEADASDEQLRKEIEEGATKIEQIEGALAEKAAEVEELKGVRSLCDDLKAQLDKKQGELLSMRTALQQEGIKLADVEAELKKEKRDRKAENRKNSEEVRLRENQIRNLKDDLRQLHEQQTDVTDVVSVRKRDRSAEKKEEPAAYEPPRSATGSGIIDAMVYHQERRKVYELEKEVKELKAKVGDYELKAKVGDRSVAAATDGKAEKGRPSTASSGIGSSYMSVVEEGDTIHVSTVEHRDKSTMPPPVARPPKRTEKQPLQESRAQSSLPPLGPSSSRTSFNQENTDPADATTPKAKAPKNKFFSPLRTKESKKSVDSPSQNCKQQ